MRLTKKDIPSFRDYTKERGYKILAPNVLQVAHETFELEEEDFQEITTSKEEYNPLIFGKDQTEKVVAVEKIQNNLVLFLHDGTTKTLPYKYWLLTKDMTPEARTLEGTLCYKYITTFEDSQEMWKEIKYLKGERKKQFNVYDEIESAMIFHGVTLYKNLKPNDLSVLAFDIEGTGLTHNKKSKVLVVTNTFRNREGKIIKKMFSVDEYDDDVAMIKDWCQWVQKVDPDIMTGHNLFMYDLPYLSYCAKRGGYELELGRDLSPIKYNKRAGKFRRDGSQAYDYVNAKIFGRQIIDGFFLSIKFDFGRKYPSYGLKAIIAYELQKANATGVRKRSDWQKRLIKSQKDRQHYDASKIGENWNIPEERYKIKEYGKDDADDSMLVYDLMIAAYFYYTQSIPRTFQQINNTATGGQINSFLIRAYLQDGHSLPDSSMVEHYEGGYVYSNPGVFHNVQKVDVASLYPSIILTNNIYDKKKDPKCKFLEMVKYFTKERLANKKKGNETGERYYKDMEQSQKIVINSAYGMMGAPFLLFNSPDNASLITKIGRDITKEGIEWAKKKNLTIVNADTDSFSYTDGSVVTKEQFGEQIEELNTLFDDGIIWEDDGQYKSVLIVKSKNYCLMDAKKNVTTKGSGLVASMKEVALKEFIDEIITLLLNKRKDHIFYLYNNYCSEAIEDKIDIKRWSSKKTITKAVLEGKETTERKIKEAIKNIDVQEGDKIRVFFDVDENVVLEQEYNNNHNKTLLLNKIYKTLEIFGNVLDMDVFPNYTLKKNREMLK